MCPPCTFILSRYTPLHPGSHGLHLLLHLLQLLLMLHLPIFTFYCCLLCLPGILPSRRCRSSTNRCTNSVIPAPLSAITSPLSPLNCLSDWVDLLGYLLVSRSQILTAHIRLVPIPTPTGVDISAFTATGFIVCSYTGNMWSKWSLTHTRQAAIIGEAT